ncbi:MAG: hypothetical protein JEY91_12440, partial [Spirochaetaceae bacterium]|nr:hypothetical protein [Spirochaetaceae bacterium]
MKKQYVIFVIIYMFFSMYVIAQDLPRIEPQNYFLQLSSIEDDLTEKQFLEGALLASGSDEVADNFTKISNLIENIRTHIDSRSSVYEKGEKILQYLHDSVFRLYIEDQTRINILLKTGSYNCVSSAVLYMAAGRSLGLTIRGVRTPDHAFVSVIIGNDIVDVETTNEWGYDPGHKKEFTDSFTGSTG